MSAGAKKKEKLKNYFLILADAALGSDMDVVRVDKVVPGKTAEDTILHYTTLKDNKKGEGRRSVFVHPRSASAKQFAEAYHVSERFRDSLDPLCKEWIELLDGEFIRACHVCESGEDIIFCLACGCPYHETCGEGGTRDLCRSCVSRVKLDGTKTVKAAKAKQHLVLLPRTPREKPTLAEVIDVTADTIHAKLGFEMREVEETFNRFAKIRDLTDKQLFDLYYVGLLASKEKKGPFPDEVDDGNDKDDKGCVVTSWEAFLKKKVKRRVFCDNHEHGMFKGWKRIGCEFCFQFHCDECETEKLGANGVTERVAKSVLKLHQMCHICLRIFRKHEDELWRVEKRIRKAELAVAKECSENVWVDVNLLIPSSLKSSKMSKVDDKGKEEEDIAMAPAPVSRNSSGSRSRSPRRSSRKQLESAARGDAEEAVMEELPDQGDAYSPPRTDQASKKKDKSSSSRRLELAALRAVDHQAASAKRKSASQSEKGKEEADGKEDEDEEEEREKAVSSASPKEKMASKPLRGTSDKTSAAKKSMENEVDFEKSRSKETGKRGRDAEDPLDGQMSNQRSKSSSGLSSKLPERRPTRSKEDEIEKDEPSLFPDAQDLERSNSRKRGRPKSKSDAQSKEKVVDGRSKVAPKRTSDSADTSRPQPAPAPNDVEARKKNGPSPKGTKYDSQKQRKSVKPQPRKNKRGSWIRGKVVEVFNPDDSSYYVGKIVEPGRVRFEGMNDGEPLGADDGIREENLYPVRASQPNELYRVSDIVDVQAGAEFANSWWQSEIIGILASGMLKIRYNVGGEEVVSKNRLRRSSLSQ